MKPVANIFSSISILLLALGAAVVSDWALANQELAVCPIGKPVAAWNFNEGDEPGKGSGYVTWSNAHGGIKNVPDTNYKGIKFNFRGKGPEGDSSSEWRYTINYPLSRTWEYLRFYQPVNFYHRYYQKITADRELDPDQWHEGDEIKSSKGMSAKVVKATKQFLYISDYKQRFDQNWGEGIEIVNTTKNVSFISKDSRNVGSNNKFSTQWQGRYSNAAMTVETEPKLPSAGGKVGEAYFRPTINKSKVHKASGTIKNNYHGKAVAFSQEDNGKIVDFVVERVRSSDKWVKDARYKIWKRTESTDWHLVFENSELHAWNYENYFDHGYVLGWSNSGYSEDTTFYLLGWQLWAEKPSFLP